MSNNGISNFQLNSIVFKDNLNGYVAGNDGIIYRTANGGQSWMPELSNTTFDLLKIKYFGDSVVCSGEYGTLLIKGQGNWAPINTRVKSDIKSIAVDNLNNIHLCGGGGFIRNNKNGSRFGL